MIQTQRPIPTQAVDPFSLVDSVAAAVGQYRDEADRLRSLPADLFEILRRGGAFRLTTPRQLGGFELTLTDSTRVLEGFGRLDGAVAWNVWNGNLGFCGALLADAGVDTIWGEIDDPVIANSARPVGQATVVDGGYRLSGRWDLVSGVDNADWVALFAMVLQGDELRFVAPGVPDVQVLFVARNVCCILDTWQVNAMRGTGSKSVVAEDVFVPEGLAISPFATARLDRPAYRIPAFTLASTGVAGVVLGMGAAALDALVELADAKPTDDGRVLADRPHAQAAVADARCRLDAARLLLFDATARIDQAAAASAPIGESLRGPLRAAMSHAASVVRAVLASTYQLASSAALYAGHPVERLFRDGNAATQHGLLHLSHQEAYGRILLGRPAGVPVL